MHASNPIVGRGESAKLESGLCDPAGKGREVLERVGKGERTISGVERHGSVASSPWHARHSLLAANSGILGVAHILGGWN